jgi:hypothetical protein
VNGCYPVPVVVQQQPPATTTANATANTTRSSSGSSSSGSRLRSLGWFSFGVAVSAGLGSYKLSQDLWNSAHAVEHVVTSIEPEIRMLEKAVNNKLAEIDQRIQRLEAQQKSK